MDLDQIRPNLLVGSCPVTAEDIDRLKEAEITAVLNVQTDADFEFWKIDWGELAARYREAGIEVRRVPVRDFDPDDLRRRLPEAARVLDELLRSGKTVYVHCSGGINRSPSTVITYLHWYEGEDLEQAVREVRSCRSCDPYMEAIRLAGEDRMR